MEQIAPGDAAARARAPRRIAGGEIAAVLCLTVGAVVVPVLAPTAGLVLAWCSRFWRIGDKIAVTVVMTIPLIPIVVLAILFHLYGGPDPYAPSQLYCTDISPVGQSEPYPC